MNTFYAHHEDSIRFQYRCFDRILLNGLIQPFQQENRVVGFFSTYRDLYPVSRDVLRDIAGQCRNWITNRSKHWQAPILEAPKGRRDEFVLPYFKAAEADQVVCILKAREPGAHHDRHWGKNRRTAGTWRCNSVGSISTTSTSTTANGAGCSCACVHTSRSPHACA